LVWLVFISNGQGCAGTTPSYVFSAACLFVVIAVVVLAFSNVQVYQIPHMQGGD
jgi:hypothetical protein